MQGGVFVVLCLAFSLCHGGACSFCPLPGAPPSNSELVALFKPRESQDSAAKVAQVPNANGRVIVWAHDQFEIFFVTIPGGNANNAVPCRQADIKSIRLEVRRDTQRINEAECTIPKPLYGSTFLYKGSCENVPDSNDQIFYLNPCDVQNRCDAATLVPVARPNLDGTLQERQDYGAGEMLGPLAQGVRTGDGGFCSRIFHGGDDQRQFPNLQLQVVDLDGESDYVIIRDLTLPTRMVKGTTQCPRAPCTNVNYQEQQADFFERCEDGISEGIAILRALGYPIPKGLVFILSAFEGAGHKSLLNQGFKFDTAGNPLALISLGAGALLGNDGLDSLSQRCGGRRISKVGITVLHEIGHIYHSVLVDYSASRNRGILAKSRVCNNAVNDGTFAVTQYSNGARQEFVTETFTIGVLRGFAR